MLEAAALTLDAKAHFGGLCLHAQLVQQSSEVRIVFLVVHDEAGIDCVAFTGLFYVNGVRVATDIIARFMHADVEVPLAGDRLQRVRKCRCRLRLFVCVFGHGYAGCSLARAYTRSGTGWRSHMMPSQESTLSPQYVGSISHQ